MTKAVFLDRDGTLIEDRGYLSSVNEVVFYSHAFDILKELSNRYMLFIVTNQSGIAKGITKEEDVNTVNHFVLETLRNEGVDIKELYSCPHKVEDGCECMKPKTHWAKLAESKYNINLAESYAVGDHPSDVMFAENFGGIGIYVLTGHGAHHKNEVSEGTIIVDGVLEAAKYILDND